MEFMLHWEVFPLVRRRHSLAEKTGAFMVQSLCFSGIPLTNKLTVGCLQGLVSPHFTLFILLLHDIICMVCFLNCLFQFYIIFCYFQMKDEVFDKEEAKFRSLEKAVKVFLDSVQQYLDHSQVCRKLPLTL